MSNRKYQITAVIVVILAVLFYVTRNHWSLVFVVFLSILLCATLLLRYLNEHFKEQWLSLANQLGVEFVLRGSRFEKLIGMEYIQLVPRYQLLTGQYRDHDILVTNDQYTLNMKIKIAKPNIDAMSISPKYTLNKKLFAQDIKVNLEYLGKDPFDKKFLVEGYDEDKIRKILDRDIQNKIMSVKNFHIQIDFNVARIEEPLLSNISYKLDLDCARFKSLIDIAIDIVEKIEVLEEDILDGKPTSDNELIS